MTRRRSWESELFMLYVSRVFGCCFQILLYCYWTHFLRLTDHLSNLSTFCHFLVTSTNINNTIACFDYLPSCSVPTDTERPLSPHSFSIAPVVSEALANMAGSSTSRVARVCLGTPCVSLRANLSVRILPISRQATISVSPI